MPGVNRSESKISELYTSAKGHEFAVFNPKKHRILAWLAKHFVSYIGYAFRVDKQGACFYKKKGVAKIGDVDNGALTQCAEKIKTVITPQPSVSENADPSKLSSYSLEDVEAFVEQHDINCVDSNGKTLLHHVVEKGSKKALSYLLEKGAKVNQGDGEGNTALHLAAKKNKRLMADLLLDYKSRTYFQNQEGETPFDLAEKKSYLAKAISIARNHEYKDDGAAYDELLYLINHFGKQEVEWLLCAPESNLRVTGDNMKKLIETAREANKSELVEYLRNL